MFTGIVSGRGVVKSVEPNYFGVRLTVDPAGWAYKPTHGDSIANNGVCLTHAPAPGTGSGSGDTEGDLVFDVIRQTLETTNLGELGVGDAVNLESSVTADTPMAGHFVQGHVDGTGEVTAIKKGSDEVRLTIGVSAEQMRLMVPKGSVAIDGVSLTIAEVDAGAGTFTVALIPTTLDLTNLGDRREGDRVNLESDMIVRSIVHVLETMGEGGEGAGVTLDGLRRAGYV